MNVPIRTPEDVQRAFSEIERQFHDITNNNLDMRSTRRIVNLPWASSGDQPVTLAQLEHLLRDVKVTLERLKNVT